MAKYDLSPIRCDRDKLTAAVVLRDEATLKERTTPRNFFKQQFDVVSPKVRCPSSLSKTERSSTVQHDCLTVSVERNERRSRANFCTNTKSKFIDKEVAHLSYRPAVHLENSGGTKEDSGWCIEF